MRTFILSALLLSACTSIVPSTALRLHALSPMEADPAGFAVAMTLPEGLEIEPDSVRLTLNATRTDTGEIRDAAFVLDRLASAGAVYRVAPDDLEALRAFQANMGRLKAEHGDAARGSLSVTLSPCTIGDGPADDARANVSIRIDPDGPFLPLIRNGPISDIRDPDEIGEMGACSFDPRQ